VPSYFNHEDSKGTKIDPESPGFLLKNDRSGFKKEALNPGKEIPGFLIKTVSLSLAETLRRREMTGAV
jgi:hypothetical protein